MAFVIISMVVHERARDEKRRHELGVVLGDAESSHNGHPPKKVSHACAGPSPNMTQRQMLRSKTTKFGDGRNENAEFSHDKPSPVSAVL